MYRSTPREDRRSSNRLVVTGLKEFLLDAAGAYCPASYIMHTTGVSRAALSKAKREGRLRTICHQCPDGHIIELVSISDACRIERYRKPRGRQHRTETWLISGVVRMPPLPKPKPQKTSRKSPPGRDAGIQEGRRSAFVDNAEKGVKRKIPGIQG